MTIETIYHVLRPYARDLQPGDYLPDYHGILVGMTKEGMSVTLGVWNEEHEDPSQPYHTTHSVAGDWRIQARRPIPHDKPVPAPEPPKRGRGRPTNAERDKPEPRAVDRYAYTPAADEVIADGENG